MYGLLDCNNFYASCERVFNPSLRNRPVVVLSNNDGCVIARSNEAKLLGIPMGVPAYQIEKEIKQFNIAVQSSNYVLYGDMSNRVMTLLSSLVHELEIYSIDEAFINFSGFERYDLKKYGSQMVDAIVKGTGIPVSLGIASTKTLAKIANRFAKKVPAYKNVCLINSEEKRIKALQLTAIEDVWGIGRRHAKRLKTVGVHTAYDFTCLPSAWVRKEMTVVGEKMWKELNGIPCIQMEMESIPKKQICTSRAFGTSVDTMEGLKEAVATFASMCAEKLRKQQSCAVSLMTFIHTNNFRPDQPQYYQNCVVKLPVATNSTLEIAHYANLALEKIYRKGYKFKKAGVIITEIVPDHVVQQGLFDPIDRQKHHRLMKVIDQLNSGFSNNSLILASRLGKQHWKMKQTRRSNCYTTDINQIITINCNR